MSHISWNSVINMPSRSYDCGYCGASVSSEKGWHAYLQPTGDIFGSIYICHKCLKPTFFDFSGSQTPGIIMGDVVESIDEKNVEDLYNEARKSSSAGAFTATVLCCRKLLMHIAVDKGDKPGKTFFEYVQFLSDNNYIPPGAKEWVDQIRKKGNEANHEIVIMNIESAKDLLSFCGMLLKIIYEFPAKVKKPTVKP